MNTTKSCVVGILLSTLAFGCRGGTKPAGNANRRVEKKAGARRPARPRDDGPTLQEVEAKLQAIKEPRGGDVLAIVYAGGIRGEIEPCG